MAVRRIRRSMSAAGYAIIGTWKALEAPLIRNSVRRAQAVESHGFVPRQTLAGTAVSTASGVMNLLRYVPRAESMGLLPG